MGNGASAINSSHCAFADDDVSIDSRCEEKFIMTAVYPHLKSYTWEDPSTEDLLISDHVRSGLNTIPLLLQFDETFYGILEKTGLSFPTKSFCFKKQFLKELLSFITDPAEKNPDLYEFQSKLFVKRYSFEDIAIEDYGQLGEALVQTMSLMDGSDGQRWGRLYSRFVRAIL